MKYLILSLWFLLAGVPAAQAAGIQVSPSSLDFVVATNKPVTHEIVVANPTADAQLYQVYADDFTSALTVFPESFTLEAGGRKTVQIAITPTALKQNNSQLLSTTLSITSQPLASGKLSVGTGVKLPITVSSKFVANKNWLVWAGLAVLTLLASAAAGIFYIFNKGYLRARRQT